MHRSGGILLHEVSFSSSLKLLNTEYLNTSLSNERPGVEPISIIRDMYVAALIHIEHLLNSARGRGGTFHPIPFIHVSVHRLMRLLVTQCIAHILGAEEEVRPVRYLGCE